jgi:hypothetical protein
MKRGLSSTIYKAHLREYMAAVGQVEREYKEEGLGCKESQEAP